MESKSKKTRINDKKKELTEIFDSLDANKKRTASGLIDRCAFMCVELDDIEDELARNGWTEEYQNGANQKGIKKSSAAEVYLTMSKTFAGIIKQLIDLCPQAKNDSRLEQLMRA